MNRTEALVAATRRLTIVAELALEAADTKDVAAYDVALADAVAWSHVVTGLRFGGGAPIVVEVAQ